jgi:hypothetical protein
MTTATIIVCLIALWVGVNVGYILGDRPNAREVICNFIMAAALVLAVSGCDEGAPRAPNFDPERFEAFRYDPSSDPAMLDGSPVQLGNLTSSAVDDKLFVKARDLSAGLLHWTDANWEWTSVSMAMSTAQDYRTRVQRGQAVPRALAGAWVNFQDTLQDRYFGTGEWRKW